tara:strand:+ start:383 stop:1072 length:690 start_codon:yes stop_codon:yes gene_type:complete
MKHSKNNRDVGLQNTWKEKLLPEFEKDYMKNLSAFLREEKAKKKIIYPPGKKIFNALNLTDFHEVKAVIVGQDPYHGERQANGLSFSVENGTAKPPSLRNIFKELKSDLRIEEPIHGDLTNWGKNGVLLLNSVLTVEAHKPGSHYNRGWERFTNKILELLSENKKVVFILWGKKAQEKASSVNLTDNFVIESAHPSPFSANNGFFGSKPFSKVNLLLREKGLDPVDWKL